MSTKPDQPADPRPSHGTDAFGQPLIYEKPHLLGWPQRLLEGGIFISGYALWGYVAWILYDNMFRRGGIKSPVFFTSGFAVVLLIFLLLVLWNRYNVWRFRGHEKRQARGATTPADMARPFRLQAADVERLQQARNVCVKFQDDQSLILTPDGNSANAITGRYSPQELAQLAHGCQGTPAVPAPPAAKPPAAG